MDWESEEKQVLHKEKDISKRIWIGIFVVTVVMLGVLYAKEGKKDIRQVGVHSKHILIGFDIGNAEMREAALKKVKDIKNQLDEGANFSKLASKYSDDPISKTMGGDLGWSAKGEMVTNFDNYLWKGPVGVYSDPIATRVGFHIIFIIERNYSDAEEYQKEIYQRLNEKNKQEE